MEAVGREGGMATQAFDAGQNSSLRRMVGSSDFSAVDGLAVRGMLTFANAPGLRSQDRRPAQPATMFGQLLFFYEDSCFFVWSPAEDKLPTRSSLV